MTYIHPKSRHKWIKVYPRGFRKNPYIWYVWAKNKTDAVNQYLFYLKKRNYRMADDLKEKDCIAEEVETPGKSQIKESI